MENILPCYCLACNHLLMDDLPKDGHHFDNILKRIHLPCDHLAMGEHRLDNDQRSIHPMSDHHVSDRLAMANHLPGVHLPGECFSMCNYH